jgi:hypothetical protein
LQTNRVAKRVITSKNAAMAPQDRDYTQWAGKLPDPRQASPDQRAAGLSSIVLAEGPVMVLRTYRLFVRASGGKQVTGRVRELLDEAVEELVTSGRLILHSEGGPEGILAGVLRLPGQPEVVSRRRGPRDLEEIPLDEIAAAVEDTWSRAPRVRDDALKRIILDRFELVRLTSGVSAHLDQAVALARPVGSHAR